MKKQLFSVIALFCVVGCTYTKLDPGPDRRAIGVVEGGASGAITGAMIGAQVGAATGPALFAGAGLGAIAGGMSGIISDEKELEQIRLGERAQFLSEQSRAQTELIEHYKRRLAMHPSREIFPADIFFFGDESKLRIDSEGIIAEVAKLYKTRKPWAEIIIASYVKNDNQKSEYATYLASQRAKEIGDHLVTAGIEPRRIKTRTVLVNQPILIDYADRVSRYNQALEFVFTEE